MKKHSKTRVCGVDHESPDEMSRAISTINQAITQKSIQDNGKQITINVVFHVMMPQNTVLKQSDTISATADIGAIINALNRDYNNTAFVASGDMSSNKYTSVCPSVSQYKAILALSKSANITFKTIRIIYANLKKIIPNDTTISTKNTIIKGASPPVNPNSCLNIWLVNDLGGGIIGYAVFPWDTANRPTYDGVVLERKVSGVKPAIGYEAFNMNRTAVHEVGHWMGLYHTFQNPFTNAPVDPSAIIDANKNGTTEIEEKTYDCVKDTPLQIAPTYGNPLTSGTWPYTLVDNNGNPTLVSGVPQSGGWTCSNQDTSGKPKSWAMFTNYMDYSDDVAMFMFTSDQVNKMRLTLLALRSATVNQ